MNGKIKQLVVIQKDTRGYDTLYALGNDGKIWEKEAGSNEWSEILGPPIGQKKGNPKRSRARGPSLRSEVAPNRIRTRVPVWD